MWMVREGYEQVKKLRKGTLYVISCPEIPEEEWFQVVVFNKTVKIDYSRDTMYKFFALAEEDKGLVVDRDKVRDIKEKNFYESYLRKYCIRKIEEEDLALYVSAQKVYTNLSHILKGDGIPQRKLKKIKRNFKARLRGAH